MRAVLLSLCVAWMLTGCAGVEYKVDPGKDPTATSDAPTEKLRDDQ